MSRKENIYYISKTGLIDPILNERQQEINRIEAKIRNQIVQQLKIAQEMIMWRLNDVFFLLLISLSIIMLNIRSKLISHAISLSPLQQLSVVFTASLSFLHNKVDRPSHEILEQFRIIIPGIVLPIMIWLKPCNEIPKLPLSPIYNRDPLILPAYSFPKKRVDVGDLSAGLLLQNIKLSSFTGNKFIKVNYVNQLIAHV